MAQIKDGLFGGFSGKIGNVVGCKGKNGFYVRSLPSHVSNPRTELQQAQRRRFSLAMQLARALTPFLHISYREFAGLRNHFTQRFLLSCKMLWYRLKLIMLLILIKFLFPVEVLLRLGGLRLFGKKMRLGILGRITVVRGTPLPQMSLYFLSLIKPAGWLFIVMPLHRDTMERPN